MIFITTTQSFLADRGADLMGFADLSIADIAAEYNLPVETVFQLCDRLGIAYKNQDTNLALEDAKAILHQILSQKPDSKQTEKVG